LRERDDIGAGRHPRRRVGRDDGVEVGQFESAYELDGEGADAVFTDTCVVAELEEPVLGLLFEEPCTNLSMPASGVPFEEDVRRNWPGPLTSTLSRSLGPSSEARPP
jgi:hypothetical protein